MSPTQATPRPYAHLPLLLGLLIGVILLIASVALSVMGRHLLVVVGENLALAAAEVASDMDRFVFERYGDIQMLAQTVSARTQDRTFVHQYLTRMQQSYAPLYQRLLVTDPQGRVIVSTSSGNAGQDMSSRAWYQLVRHDYQFHIGYLDASDTASPGRALIFTAPIIGAHGDFLGVALSEVGMAKVEALMSHTVQLFEQREEFMGTLSSQVLLDDGGVLFESLPADRPGEGPLNGPRSSPSLLSEHGGAGYVEELDLRRHVPVLSGYARTGALDGAGAVQWTIVLRKDRQDILAPIRWRLWVLGGVGALAILPLVGVLLWSVHRLRQEWNQTEVESQLARKAEVALRESESRLASILNNSPAMIFLKDPQGRYLFVNREFATFCGLPSEQVVGKTDLDLFSERQALGFQAHDAKVWASGTAMEFEEVAAYADGSHVSLVLKFPIRDLDGHMYALCGIVTDVTMHRQLEQRLRQSQKLEAVGRLAGGIAHDFNNLLAVIKGYVHRLRGMAAVVPTAQKPLAGIDDVANRAAALIKQLLTFSRDHTPCTQVMSLNTVVEGVVRLLRRILGSDIVLEVSLAPDLAAVKIDPGQVEQALINLVINARDAMPHGGRLLIATSTVEVNAAHPHAAHLAVLGAYVCVVIRDTGCGMTEEVLSHMFEPFFTTKPRGHGTGLGLSTVYGILKQHHGAIVVESLPDHGTTFRLYWPVTTDPFPEAGPADVVESLEIARGTETVLLVDDQAELRALLAEELRLYGYTVLDVATGQDAVTVITRTTVPIHLLITDIVMPGVNGRDLAAQVRVRFPDLPVIYISGYTDAVLALANLSGSREAILRKPFHPEALVRKVRAMLDESASTSAPLE